ncbi:MAG: recombinase family protein [Phocaeicola dorei]
MAKVGYVMNYAGYRANTDKEWMKRFGCNEIMEEQQDYELRTEWNKLLDRLNKGDELVVPKLSHVLRETRQLSYLLEYCRLKEIRLISIHDRIDSGNELFPETQMSDILNVVALLPKEAFDIRKSSDAVRKVKSRMRTLSPVDYNRIERKEFVVNMYKSGHLINEIWKASGFRSRSSVFRVLKEAGITLNRGRKKDKPLCN